MEVNVLNHHGNKSSENEFLVRTLRPRIHIIQVWSAHPPGEGVPERLQSTRLYPEPRDLFATNMIEANK